jgi:hypothetical protein
MNFITDEVLKSIRSVDRFHLKTESRGRREMGCCKSVCKVKEAPDLEEQYQRLMSAKPAPVPLAAVRDLGFADDGALFDDVSSESDPNDTKAAKK